MPRNVSGPGLAFPRSPLCQHCQSSAAESGSCQRFTEARQGTAANESGCERAASGLTSGLRARLLHVGAVYQASSAAEDSRESVQSRYRFTAAHRRCAVNKKTAGFSWVRQPVVRRLYGRPWPSLCIRLLTASVSPATLGSGRSAMSHSGCGSRCEATLQALKIGCALSQGYSRRLRQRMMY